MKRYATLLILVFIITGAWFFHYSSTKTDNLQRGESATTTNTSATETSATLKGIIRPGTDGWSLYENSEWSLSFTYPSDWKVVENRVTEESKMQTFSNRPVGSLSSIRAEGDGFIFGLSRFGMDAPSNASHPKYVIAGHDARTWMIERPDGFSLIASLYPACSGLVISVKSPISFREIADKFLASITCE